MKNQEKSVTVCVEKDGDGFYAYAPALKGLHVGGSTEEEVLRNAKDGIILYLESLINHRESLPEGPHLKIKKYNHQRTKEISVEWPFQMTPDDKSRVSQ